MSAHLKPPMSGSILLHHIGYMEAEAAPDNGGAVSIHGWNDGWEVAGLTIFTQDPALSVALADAINDVLLKHGRLNPDSASLQPEQVAA